MPLVEEPLEGPQHRPTRLASSEVQLALRVEGYDRGDGVRVLEGNDRVVPPIDHGYDRMGGAKIDAKPHARSVSDEARRPVQGFPDARAVLVSRDLPAAEQRQVRREHL